MAGTEDLNSGVLGLKLTSCKIGGKEFRTAVSQLDYYEDIFSNFVSGSLMLSASTSFQEDLKWSGNEYIDLELSKPGIESLEGSGQVKPLKMRLRIFDIKARKLGNDGNENYYITFCSPHLIISEQTKISKSYKDKRIDEIIKDIVVNYLKIDEKKFDIKKTFGKRDIVIPKMKPLEAINWLCTQAIAEDLDNPLESGAEYLFWANRDGFRCWSILHIYKDLPNMIYRNPLSAIYSDKKERGQTEGYWYGTKNVDQGSGEGEKWDEYEHIISLEVMNTYDTVESSQRGMYGNAVLSLDYVRRRHEVVTFNYNKYWDYLNGNITKFKEEKYNNIKPFNFESQDADESEIDRSIQSTIKMYPSTTTQQDSEYLQLLEAYDYPNYVETFVPYRYAQLGLVSHQRLKIALPGDPFMPIGLVVKVNFPKTSKTIEEKGEKEDKTLSGWYLITAVRHTLNQENDFKTIVELVKEAKHKTTM